MSKLANETIPDRKNKRLKTALTITLVSLILLIVINPAFASEAGTGLEWEAPFQAFYRSITGPVAFGISFLGIVVCGAALIWGGEINEFVRKMVMVILVVALIMFAGSILRRMFAGGAATITPIVTMTSGSQHEDSSREFI